MVFVLIFNLINYVECGLLLGDKTPLGRLKRYFSPTPSFAFFLSKEIKFFDLGLSFSYSRFSNQYSNLYFLSPQISLEPSILKIKNIKGTLFFGLSYSNLIREIYEKKEKGSYLGRHFGFGYKEEFKKVNFRMKIYLSFIPEKLTYENKYNLYYLLNFQIGVGYEF